MSRRAMGACVVAALMAVACGIPRDPDGTLDRVGGGTMRVGIVPSDPC